MKTKGLFSGLLGLGNDCMTLYHPDGSSLFKAPKWIAPTIQRIQHRIFWLTYKQKNVETLLPHK